MQIGFDAKRAFSNYRGLGNYSRDVIRLMRTYAPENDYVLFGVPTSRCDTSGVRVEAPRGGWKMFPALWRSFGCITQMDGLDIYHGLSGELPYGIHRRSVRTVVTMHDAIFMRYPELYSTTYRHLFARKVQYACEHADRIIAISEQTKRDMITYFHADEAKIRVVYQGCSNIFREPVTGDRMMQISKRRNLPSRYVLTVGAIEPRKNLRNLIEAMSIAQPDMPLIAVGGKSGYAEQMAQLARRRGVRLRFIHNLPFDELPALYKGASLFCYPSVFEGFGIPILEAMCVGTPVLTSTGSCFSETGGDAALYADPLLPEEIARQITAILGKEEIRETMRTKGKEQAEKFTDEKVAQHLIQVYHELCAS